MQKENQGKEFQQGKMKGIKSKMMKGIIGPSVLILAVVGMLLVAVVKGAADEMRSGEITAESGQVTNRISEYFTKYMEVTRQLAANQELRDMFAQLKPGMAITDSGLFDNVRRTMTNVSGTDEENILVTWIADADSSQCIEDENSGYVSALGEWDITTRDWYTQAKDAGRPIVTEPYQNSSTGQTVASVITPMYGADGGFEGVAAVDVAVDTLGVMMGEYKLGDSGFFILLTPQGNIMYAPDQSVINTSFLDLDIEQKVIDAFQNGTEEFFTYTISGNQIHGCLKKIGDSGWFLLSGMPDQEYNSVVLRLSGIIIGFFLLAILCLVAVINLIASGIVKPLKKLKLAADEIAGGNLDIEVGTGGNDEVGAVAAALDKTVARLKDYIAYISEITVVLNEIANGQLRFQLKQDYVGEFRVIKEAMENLSAKLTATIQDIDKASRQVSGGAEQIAGGAHSIADGAASQAGAVEELQATVTEIASQVGANAEASNHAAARVREMEEELAFSNKQMENTVAAMQEIKAASGKISAIITTIEEIADQTNLLSLNASIEAARAGEVGRGFAVVAGEVSNLAGESMEAVKHSGEMIANSSQAVERGMEIVSQAAAQMAESLEHIDSLKRLIEDINEASQVQNSAIGQIRQALEQVSEVVTDNSAMAEESAAASVELSSQSQSLMNLISAFKI